MATGADIPPELFKRILDDVCEDAWLMVNPRINVPNRKEAIKNVTACSLTCVYWAQICRQELFGRVWIKSCEDMRAFSLLVSSTPKIFQPISNHVRVATLEQRVGDRPWIHLLQMQPSLFLFRRHVGIFIEINDLHSTDEAIPPQCLTYRRIFSGLPRTPPSSCLHCEELTIGNAHFATPHDLVSLTGRLALSINLDCSPSITFDGVIWDPQIRFESNLLTGDPLEIQEEHCFHVSIRHSEHIAEAAWLAFATPYRRILQRSGKQIRRILSPAQRAILGICTLLTRGTSGKVPRLDIAFSRLDEPDWATLFKDRVASVKKICQIWSTLDVPDHTLVLLFCHADFVGPSGRILAIDHISMLCINVTVQNFLLTEMPSTLGDSPTDRIQHVITYPWKDIVEICAEQEGFMRLQLKFQNHVHLTLFMQAQRAALSKLNGRIGLFYYRKKGYYSRVAAADFETLNELPGDAETEHGYINY